MSEKEIVMRVDVDDDDGRRRAFIAVSVLSGINSISMAMKDKKMKVTGVVDPFRVVDKLKKHWHVEIVHVGPKEADSKSSEETLNTYPPYNPYWTNSYMETRKEEYPSTCVIF
ncbi:heavy metal-associated isoprenylated plant protein 39-like isoform X2 [Wolffia australiana]